MGRVYPDLTHFILIYLWCLYWSYTDHIDIVDVSVFANTRQGVWAKILKLSHCGLISAVLLGTVVEGDGGICLGGVYEVAVEVGWCVCKMQGRGGALGQKPETELLWLSFGRAMWNRNGDGGEGWWGGTYQAMVVCSQTQGGEEGWGSKSRNQAAVAWLLVHSAKLR
jgi:hypothetical protein